LLLLLRLLLLLLLLLTLLLQPPSPSRSPFSTAIQPSTSVVVTSKLPDHPSPWFLLMSVT
jgi:hypothetical protein